MESETNRISDKPQTQMQTTDQISSQPDQPYQQQGVPVNIQQNYKQPNQAQQPYYSNQPITYQPLNYQQVIVNPGQPNLIVNQGAPIIYTPVEFKYRRVYMVCPYCNNPIKTKVEQKFNFCTCITICLCILLILFALGNGNGNLGNGCDCRSNQGCCCCCCCCCYDQPKQEEEEEDEERCCECCNDAIHTCPVCGKFLGRHTTCCC